MKLRVSLTPEKASSWSAIIRRRINDGSISHPDLEKLIGKLRFSQTCLFGKFARTQIRCLYRKLYAPSYSHILSQTELIALHWWVEVISNLKPRIPRGVCQAPDFVIYNDAATITMRIAALLFQGGSSPPPTILHLAVSRVPRFWRTNFNSKNEIFGLGMLAPLAFIWMHGKKSYPIKLPIYILITITSLPL